MKPDNIHTYRKQTKSNNSASSIFTNAKKHKNRRLQRINIQDIKKKNDPETEKERRKKIQHDRIKNNSISIMLSILLVFALLSLFYWAALK